MHDALLTLHFLSLLAYAFVKFEDKHEAEVLITINNLYSHNYAFYMYCVDVRTCAQLYIQYWLINFFLINRGLYYWLIYCVYRASLE